MPLYRSIADWSDHNVLNLFAYSGSYPVSKGTFVKIASSWFNSGQNVQVGNVGASYPNTVSQRYSVAASVTACSATGDAAIGMLLYDGREYDENGEKLIFKPRKAAEMECFISGQTAPIVTKGVFYYSGIAGNPTPGAAAYLGTDGGLNVTGGSFATSVSGVVWSFPSTAKQVGTFLGAKDGKGFALVKIDV